MTFNDDPLVRFRYSPDDLKLFSRIIEPSTLSSKHIEQLRIAARNYMLLAIAEAKPGDLVGTYLGKVNRWLSGHDNWAPLIPSRSERRKALQRVETTARALKVALKDPKLLFLNNDQLRAFDIKSLDELAKAAHQIVEQIPMGGADPKEARIFFVGRLASIYENITGKRAARWNDGASGLDSGPFLEFAQASLRPLNAAALKGLENVVRKVTIDRSGK